MLELDFPEFMEQVDKMRKMRDKTRRVHYQENSSGFTLFIRSVDYWEYFTVINIEDIIRFGLQYETDKNQAIADFKSSILHDAIKLKPLEEESIETSEEQIEKQPKPEEQDKEEAKDYADFLKKNFDKWERQILIAIDTTLKDEFLIAEKTLGEFFQRLFNVVNTAGWIKSIRRIIKVKYREGWDDTEKELDMNIPVAATFEQDIEQLVSRQLDGFTIIDENGKPKRWQGIKGTTREIQDKVSKIVRDGIANRSTIKDIKKEIKTLFIKEKGGKVKGKVTEGRAMKIARTESNRFFNQGKLKAAKESGLKLKKKWVAFLDKNPDGTWRTSQVCRDLFKRKSIPLNETFKWKGQEFDAPPAHPNCRSVLDFVPSK